jgi:polysaccharide export outer membrane protein
MLGKIKVEGLTRTQLVDLLTKKIKQYVTDPVVIIQFQNYKVTVIGEVRNPGTFNLPSERTTILQALGLAGDLTIQAKRDDVLLIRECDGKQIYYKIDLRKSELLSSPAYYVQQNDVIYVEPSTSRIATGTNIGSVWSIVLSSITTILTIVAITK